MWVKLLHMMSSTSLSAFSVVTPSNSANNPIRPVRDTTRTASSAGVNASQGPYGTDQTQSAPPQNTLPLSLPNFPANQIPPRGSLLNLSV